MRLTTPQRKALRNAALLGSVRRIGRGRADQATITALIAKGLLVWKSSPVWAYVLTPTGVQVAS